MTHEELLAKIGNPIDEGYEYGDIVFNKALRAIVEMHRPALDKEMNEFAEDDGHFGCAGCGYDFNYGTWEVGYPCRTIQAIEKELM